jgi:hypothetical protein
LIPAKDRVTTDATDISDRVLRFLAENIDTVPQLEALLLLWQEPSKSWTADEIAGRVYVTRETGQLILRALQARRLATSDDLLLFRYSKDWDESGTLIDELATTYRRHLVRIATLIHNGASSSVRDFARAFDLKRDR